SIFKIKIKVESLRVYHHLPYLSTICCFSSFSSLKIFLQIYFSNKLFSAGSDSKTCESLQLYYRFLRTKVSNLSKWVALKMGSNLPPSMDSDSVA
ncbi:unnamed protein product, partial [Arabidopsis halleri]